MIRLFQILWSFWFIFGILSKISKLVMLNYVKLLCHDFSLEASSNTTPMFHDVGRSMSWAPWAVAQLLTSQGALRRSQRSCQDSTWDHSRVKRNGAAERHFANPQPWFGNTVCIRCIRFHHGFSIGWGMRHRDEESTTSFPESRMRRSSYRSGRSGSLF